VKNFSIGFESIIDDNHPFGRTATVLSDRGSLACAKERRTAIKAMEAGNATMAQIALVEEADAAVQSAIRGMPRS
jgi:hypothetical protein